MTRGVLTERRRFIIVRYRAASAFAPLPFDKHGVPGSIEFVDDFLGTNYVASAEFADTTGIVLNPPITGMYHWWGTEIAGDGAPKIIGIVSESDHQGIVRITSGNTTPANGDAATIQFGGGATGIQNQFLLDTNGIYIAAVLRHDVLTTTISEFGLAGQAPAVPYSGVADIIAWSLDSETTTNISDEEWFAGVNGGGSDTMTISKAVSYVANDWVLLEIAADTTSATFRITTEDGTETIVLDGADGVTMPTVALRPFFTVEAQTTTEAVLDIDLFVIRYMRRQPLTAGWLGQ